MEDNNIIVGWLMIAALQSAIWFVLPVLAVGLVAVVAVNAYALFRPVLRLLWVGLNAAIRLAILFGIGWLLWRWLH